jgi:diaminopimelate decarboxylase
MYRKKQISKIDICNILAIMNAGTYGYSMSSNYILRLSPAEVMAFDGKAKLIRKR